MRGRLAKDDFVEDDGVQGYMDNGVDDFEELERLSESEDAPKVKGKPPTLATILDILYTMSSLITVNNFYHSDRSCFA